MDGGEEVTRGLVVAHGDGTKLLEFGDKKFSNEVTRHIDVVVVVAKAVGGLPWAESPRFCRPQRAAR